MSTKLLLISDNAKDVLTLRMMSAEVKGKPYDLVIAKTLKDGLQQLKKGDFGLVLLDLTIKGNKGLEALLELEEKKFPVPIVILTAREEQSVAMEAVKLGAQDYLIKGRLDANVMARVIHYAMERHRVMEDMKEKNRELERLSALKSEFVSTVSHELRTPLTVILSSTNNLLDGAIGALADDQRKWIKKINGHALRLHDMINDILDLSKLQSGRTEIRRNEVDAATLVHTAMDAIAVLAQEKKMQLQMDFVGLIPSLWADAGHIERVLTNLLTNALKYTPEGGHITVTVQPEKEYVQFTVADSGPGIEPKHQEMIFERFRQLRQKDDPDKATQGIGLGLAISKEIVTQHGGKIWVESKIGEGCKFAFTIPIKSPVQRAKAA